jgi:hypothetical protein
MTTFADGRIEAFVGPQELGAAEYNDENIFVLGFLLPVSRGVTVSANQSESFAVHMKRETQRIIADLSEPYAP